ncbi:MAG: hypothetical protein CMJ83_01290 [Planctomycetes bacterium]|nr:hypothetical protein [Planctomycetota bacterium]
MRLTCLVLFALTVSVVAQPCASVNANSAVTDWFVDAASTSANPNGSKTDPFVRLGDVIGAADDNDRIFVAPGTYSPSQTGETFPYQWGANSTLSQLGIEIIGTGGAAVTILDGEGLTSGVGILRFRQLAAGAKFRGFTLRGYAGTLGSIRLGSTTPGFEAHGVEIHSCVFDGSAGSGIATFGASDDLKFHDNVFTGCVAEGIWASDITINLNPCSGATGGGEIYNNTLDGNGNGIRLQGGAWTVMNNVVTNSTNSGIYDFGGAPVFSYTLDFNCVFGNGTNYQAVTAGPSSISVDPAYVNPAGGDYHLMPTSPCVDAGTPGLPSYMGADLDDDPRNLAGATGIQNPDMGSDEVTDVRLSVPLGISIGFGATSIDLTGPAGDVAVRAVSLGEGNLLLPEGNVLLELSSLVLFDPVPVPIPGGGLLIFPIATAGFPPSTIGLPLYLQAVVASPTAIRLTNRVTVVVCP